MEKEIIDFAYKKSVTDLMVAEHFGIEWDTAISKLMDCGLFQCPVCGKWYFESELIFEKVGFICSDCKEKDGEDIKNDD